MNPTYDPAFLDALEALEFVISRQPVKIRKPVRTHMIRIYLGRVADLRFCTTLEPFGYPLSAFGGEDWTLPQEVGGAAAWLGLGGLIVSSARHSDGNVVVFVTRLGPNDRVDLLPASTTNDL